MNDRLEEIRNRIASLSNTELIDMLEKNSHQYTPEALSLAREEVDKRGELNSERMQYQKQVQKQTTELTPEERKRIYEEEKERGNARIQIESERKAKKINGFRIGCLVLIGVFFLLWLIGTLTQSDKSGNHKSSGSPTTTSIGTDEQVQQLRDLKLLKKIHHEYNEAFIDPVIWAGLDYQTKENIGRILAFYCGRKKETNLNWVDIKDNYSGKKLAKYSENWGFETK